MRECFYEVYIGNPGLEKRLGGVAEQGYTSLYGKCQVVVIGRNQMTNYKVPGINLEPNTKSLADGTNALQPGRPPGISLTPPAPVKGNPGKYLGPRSRAVVIEGVQHWGNFHLIEAIEGTWLSAATRKLGWGEVYGPEDGYGAYVPGIVRREDGSYISGPAADKIEPGERFFIKIYEGKGGRMPRRGLGTLPPDIAARLDPGGIGGEIATIVDLGVDVILDILVEFNPILTPLTIAKQVFGSVTAVLRASNSNENMAAIRAQCYAITAFVWQEYEGKPLPLSIVFSSRLLSGLLPSVEKAWTDSWNRSTRELNTDFKEKAKKFYMEVSRRGGNVDLSQLYVLPLRKHLNNRAVDKHKTAAQFCDTLLKDAASYWKNKITAGEKGIWEYHRETKYPN